MFHTGINNVALWYTLLYLFLSSVFYFYNFKTLPLVLGCVKRIDLFLFSLFLCLSSLKSVAAAAAAGLGCLVGNSVLCTDTQVTYTVRGATACTVAGTR
jgi:hypothetical protein